jgi:hypothetical protein
MVSAHAHRLGAGVVVRHLFDNREFDIVCVEGKRESPTSSGRARSADTDRTVAGRQAADSRWRCHGLVITVVFTGLTILFA